MAKKAKKAAKGGRSITAQVVALGNSPVTVKLAPKSANVLTALAMAGVAPSTSQEAWLNGERAANSAKLADGDTIVIVSPKAAGAY